MGRLSVGDAVLDEAGRPCRVTAKFESKIDEQYRLMFSDGTCIDACADHQWVTWIRAERKALLRSPYEDVRRFPDNWPRWRLRRKRGADLPRAEVEAALVLIARGMSVRAVECETGLDRRSLAKHIAAGVYVGRDVDSPGPQIRTTREIARTLIGGGRGDPNHCIPCARPLDLPDAEFGFDPWLLGYWLGNGTVGQPEVTSGSLRGEMDAPHVAAQLDQLRLPYSRRDSPEHGQTNFRILHGTFVPPPEKHIPQRYLRGSIAQRLGLLRGLMDSDGYGEASKVEFSSSGGRLAREVAELARTLGEKPRLYQGRASLNGEDCGPRWRVVWRPVNFNPFSLPRKAARIGLDEGTQALRNRYRMIIAAERIDPVPMSCITVGSPNSMYLVGEGMIPTHNTRTAVENIARLLRGPSPLIAPPGAPAVLSFVADTAFDMRQYSVEGPSGFLNVGPPEYRPRYHPGQNTLQWANGARALLFSAEDPEATRGASGSFFWWDELAKARRSDLGWSNLLFGMREGKPRGIVTTTPRPVPIIKRLVKAPSTVVTVGSTWDNRTNISKIYYDEVIAPLEGTRMGRQEINAEIIDDLPGALWTRSMIDAARGWSGALPDFSRVVVAIDPSGARTISDIASSSIGIVVAARGIDGRGYVLADRSCKLSPAAWAKRAIDAYHEFGADRIIAERNFGGAMVEHTIRSVDANVGYSEVVASRGKVQRAEPVAALYERGFISHIGRMDELESQMVQMATDGYMGEGSPDRVDALVWALSELLVTGSTYDHTMSWVA